MQPGFSFTIWFGCAIYGFHCLSASNQVNVDDREIDAMHTEVKTGATKGLALSTLFSAGMCAGLYQVSENFRNLRAPLKCMFSATSR
jgi:hypothetical protein